MPRSQWLQITTWRRHRAQMKTRALLHIGHSLPMRAGGKPTGERYSPTGRAAHGLGRGIGVTVVVVPDAAPGLNGLIDVADNGPVVTPGQTASSPTPRIGRPPTHYPGAPGPRRPRHAPGGLSTGKSPEGDWTCSARLGRNPPACPPRPLVVSKNDVFGPLSPLRLTSPYSPSSPAS